MEIISCFLLLIVCNPKMCLPLTMHDVAYKFNLILSFFSFYKNIHSIQLFYTVSDSKKHLLPVDRVLFSVRVEHASLMSKNKVACWQKEWVVSQMKDI